MHFLIIVVKIKTITSEFFAGIKHHASTQMRSWWFFRSCCVIFAQSDTQLAVLIERIPSPYYVTREDLVSPKDVNL
jgi:hypothetical protein